MHILLQFCGECMDLPIRPRWSAQQVQKVCQKSTSELNQQQQPVSICSVCLQAADGYAARLVSGHATSCPWRDTVCDAKLGKFPKLPARDVYVDFEQRYARLDGISHLPPLSEQAVAALQRSHGCGLLLLRLCSLLHVEIIVHHVGHGKPLHLQPF